MISAFQETKLRMFYNILDYDKNGFIEIDDFEGIGENICLILGIDEDVPAWHMVMEGCRKVWTDVYEYVDTNRDEKASFYEWLRYADEKIVNCDDEAYNSYVNSVVEHIFQMFDQDEDNYISLKEYLDIFMSFRLEVRYSAKAFTKIDKNSDDMISREELRAAVYDFFRSDDVAAKGNWLFGSWEELSID